MGCPIRDSSRIYPSKANWIGSIGVDEFQHPPISHERNREVPGRFTLRRFKVIGLFFALLLAVGPLVGGAHVRTVYEGADYAQSNDAHTRVTVCDRESDNNPAYTRFTRTGASGTYRFDDPNGGSAGCGVTPAYYYILSFKVCEGQVWEDPCSVYVTP